MVVRVVVLARRIAAGDDAARAAIARLQGVVDRMNVDVVRIEECRPISRNKTWMFMEKVGAGQA